MSSERKIKKIMKIAKWLMLIMFLLCFGVYAEWIPETMTMRCVIIGIILMIIVLGQYKDKLKNTNGIEKVNDNDEVLTIADLLNEYADCPQGFEEFCAALFEKMGYEAGNTAKTNDGGYDVWMKKDGINYIAECKLYAADNKIGRPLIQKLVGANATQRADKMVFITTSSFSKPAKEYAAEQKVWLIDGEKLQKIIDEYY